MPNLKLWFSIRPTSVPLVPAMGPQGPWFHRWLPDGRNDAITLSPDDDSSPIRIWFERRTKKDGGGFLSWHIEGKDFDPAIMRRQAALDAGYLFGDMQHDISEEELTSLVSNPKRVGESFGSDDGDDVYVRLGKRVVRLLYPPLSRFIATLRNQYGQTWLLPLEDWDSRKMTLGSYCNSTLGLRWWHDQNQAWYWFLPTKSGQTLVLQGLPGRGFEEFLTEADWRRLQQSRCAADVSTEVQLIGNATASMSTQDYRQAFVEVITALEIAVSRRFASQNQVIQPVLQRFFDREPQSVQVALVMLALNLDEREIESALSAIKIRNKTVHEGYQPTPQEAELVRSVMHTIRKVSGIDEIKSPVLTGSNRLSAPEA